MMNTKRRCHRCFERIVWTTLLLVCAAAWANTVVAQETVNYASVSGRVTDPSGAVVPGAQVTVRHTETNSSAAAETDGEGRFRFPYLKLGLYEITIRKAGFADAIRRLTLTIGAAFDLPVSLTLGTVSTNVNVTAQATVIEAARSQIAGTISQSEVRNLPMNGRNFLDLALLVPGVSPTNVGSTQLFAETSAVPGQGISVGSQRNFSNNFIVDGLSANDDAAGLSGIPYGVDAVEQFQVVTSGGQAELGRALGGYINVVTKSGTNATRGDFYDYVRDDRFNAPNALSGKTLPMSQSQYGASFGGPIVRDRTFFFSNFEQRKLDQSGLVVVDPVVVNTINARLAAVGYPGAPVTTGEYPNPVHSTNVLGKLDHQVGGQDQFSVRYSLYNVNSSNSRGAGGTSAPSASAGLDNTDHSLAFGNTMTLSARTVNETRAQFSYASLNALPTDPIGPAVSIAGVTSFGTLSGSPTGRLNKMFEVVDNLSHQAGTHALRVGVDFLYNRDTITYPRSIRGAYTFSSLATFLSGVYNNSGFTQTFGTTVISQTNPNVGVYAQDEWKVNPRVTLNAGLRYDLQFIETINTDRNNVSPRVGLAWLPFDSRRTAVRGSAGLYFDRVPLRAVANALLSAGNTTDLANLRQISVSLSPAQAGAPTFPNILSTAVSSPALFNLTTMNPNMQNAYSRQASLEVEQQLGLGSTVSVGYQYTRGLNLIIQVNQNVPTCVAAGTNNGCRPVSTYANNSQYSPSADSNYHGLHVSFVQRPTRWGNYRVSYSYSQSMNNVGEAFFSSPVDPFDLSKDWGRSDDDQRHRLVLSGSVHSSMEPAQTAWRRITHGFQVSSMLQAYSALPFNITSGVTTVQGTTGRPLVNGAFIERNAGEGSDFFSLGLRVSRAFPIGKGVRLEGQLEAFNLTDRVNNLTRQANFGAGADPASPAPNFNTITAVGDPRTLQFGLRLRF
jgi:Carboxypeptidase regulatory-like domain/TonB dependent receptor-like, beta-barrel